MSLRLDIGCGGRGSRQPGFVGIDIWPRPDGKSEDEYVRLDFVTDDLPWSDGTVDEAIALHIVEHLSPDHGRTLIERAYALLKPGAELVVTCPDLKMLAQAYVNGDKAFLSQKHLRGGKELWPGSTLADRLCWAITMEGHVWAYDLESLAELAVRAHVPRDAIRPLELGGRWHTRVGHETGIHITKEA